MFRDDPQRQNELRVVGLNFSFPTPIIVKEPSTTMGPSLIIRTLVGSSGELRFPGFSSVGSTFLWTLSSSFVRSLLSFHTRAWVGHLFTTSIILRLGAPSILTQGLLPGLKTSISSLKHVVAWIHFEGIQNTVMSPLVYCLFRESVIL